MMSIPEASAEIGNNTVNAAADVVIGNGDFTNTTPVGNSGKVSVTGLASDGQKLIIANGWRYSSVIFNTFPTTNGASADVVLGQPDFDTTTRWYPSNSPTLYNFDLAEGPAVCNGKLFIPDRQRGGTLVFNTIPTANYSPADFVLTWSGGGEQAGAACNGTTVGIYNSIANVIYLGSPVPNTNVAANVVISGLSYQFVRGGIALTANKLIAVDAAKHRVLIWNTIPPSNTTVASADVVIGQTDMNGTSANQGRATPGADTLNSPFGVYTDGVRLFVLDRANNRVLIFKNIPTSNGASADIVIGQPDFVSGTANNGGISARTLSAGSYGNGITSTATKLAIGDYNNSRVLIYNFLNTPSHFESTAASPTSLSFSVDPFTTALGASKYSFVSTSGHSSGWISSPTWTDTGLLPGSRYTTTVKYGTGDGIESATGSLVITTPTTFTDTGTIPVATGTGITINAPGKIISLVGDTTLPRLTVTAGTLDLGNASLTVTGTFTNAGTIRLTGDKAVSTPTNAAGSTVTYTAVSGSRSIKDWSYAHLTIDGNGGTFILPGNMSLAGALSILGGTLRLNDYRLTVAGDISNAGLITPGAGSIVHSATLMVSNPSSVGTTVFFSLTDSDQNLDGTVVETVPITVTDTAGDRETLVLRESAAASGFFTGGIPLVHGTVVTGNGTLENDRASFSVTGTYGDARDTTDQVSATTGTITDAVGVTGSVAAPASAGGGRRSSSVSVPVNAPVRPAASETPSPVVTKPLTLVERAKVRAEERKKRATELLQRAQERRAARVGRGK